MVKALNRLGFYTVRELEYFKIAYKLEKLLKLKVDRLLCIDLGCGSGHITRKLSKICDATIGLDIRRSSEWVADIKTDFVIADARRIPIRQESMNLTVFLSLLEHIPRWNEVVKEVSRVRRVGIVIVQLPNLHFIVEPHTKFPLLAILLQNIRHKISSLNNYSDLQFDCTLNNVIATLTKIRSLKVVGI
jgi:ubiquinone/menaquinone biosynthesis C-methylase UbiE